MTATTRTEDMAEKLTGFLLDEGIDGFSVIEDEPFFSWGLCECCGARAGNRYVVQGYRVGVGPITTYVHHVCEDCVYFEAYGELPAVSA